MRTAFEQAIRPFISVTSHVKEREAPIAIVARPEVGLRWGKPSTFVSDRSESEDEIGGSVYKNQYVETTGVEVYREYEIVRAEAITTPGLYFDFERPTMMIFKVGNRKDDATKTKNNQTQPITIYVAEYIQMSFPLSEHGNVINKGTRGTHPEDEALQKQIDYYNGVEGNTQRMIIRNELLNGGSWRTEGIPYKWLHL